MILMVPPFFIKNNNIFLMTWIFVDPLFNDIIMLQLLDTQVNLPLLWQLLLIIGGLGCEHLSVNMWLGVAPVSSLKLIDIS